MSLGRHLDRIPGNSFRFQDPFQHSRLPLLSGKSYGFPSRRSSRTRFHGVRTGLSARRTSFIAWSLHLLTHPCHSPSPPATHPFNPPREIRNPSSFDLSNHINHHHRHPDHPQAQNQYPEYRRRCYT